MCIILDARTQRVWLFPHFASKIKILKRYGATELLKSKAYIDIIEKCCSPFDLRPHSCHVKA